MAYEKEIAEYEKRTGIKLDAHQRDTMRDIIRKEDRFWDKFLEREEAGHSNSPVGDNYNR